MKQIAASLLLAYAAYITYTCPCAKLNKCHFASYFGAVGLATSIVLYDNGMLPMLPGL
jgi:hypothetical protein